ncbi:hypothetical protein NSQ54_03975 [Alkalihalobacillus sp. FSL W8-0930]
MWIEELSPVWRRLLFVTAGVMMVRESTMMRWESTKRGKNQQRAVGINKEKKESTKSSWN